MGWKLPMVKANGRGGLGLCDGDHSEYCIYSQYTSLATFCAKVFPDSLSGGSGAANGVVHIAGPGQALLRELCDGDGDGDDALLMGEFSNAADSELAAW